MRPADRYPCEAMDGRDLSNGRDRRRAARSAERPSTRRGYTFPRAEHRHPVYGSQARREIMKAEFLGRPDPYRTDDAIAVICQIHDFANDNRVQLLSGLHQLLAFSRQRQPPPRALKQAHAGLPASLS